MKKLCLLSGMMVFGIVSINASQRLTQEQREKLEQVQREKSTIQVQLERQPAYKMIDALVSPASVTSASDIYAGKFMYESDVKVDWVAVFNILDRMKGVVDVNEYRTYQFHNTLLIRAIIDGNFLAVKTLLEKYKANPNLTNFYGSETPLMLACQNGDLAIVGLLLKYGANPNLQDEQGKNSFNYAQGKPAILDLLRKYTSAA